MPITVWITKAPAEVRLNWRNFFKTKEGLVNFSLAKVQRLFQVKLEIIASSVDKSQQRASGQEKEVKSAKERALTK